MSALDASNIIILCVSQGLSGESCLSIMFVYIIIFICVCATKYIEIMDKLVK